MNLDEDEEEGNRTMLINGRDGGYDLGGYSERPPPRGLDRWVEVFWSYETGKQVGSAAAIGHRVIPETGLSVCVVSRSDGRGRIEDPRVWLMGPVARPRLFRPEAGVRMDGVRFKVEWCRDILGLHPSEHEDAFDRLSARPGARLGPLVRNLDALRTCDEVGRLLGRFTEGLVQARPSADAARAHALLEAVRRRTEQRLGLRERAVSMGLSERHLRRTVGLTTGRGPKHFHRIRRLQYAVSLADGSAGPHWSAVAARSGYADQAHLIHEVRRLTSATPRALHAERASQRTREAGRFLQSTRTRSP